VLYNQFIITSRLYLSSRLAVYTCQRNLRLQSLVQNFRLFSRLQPEPQRGRLSRQTPRCKTERSNPFLTNNNFCFQMQTLSSLRPRGPHVANPVLQKLTNFKSAPNLGLSNGLGPPEQTALGISYHCNRPRRPELL
jgi:hypothetical protein